MSCWRGFAALIELLFIDSVVHAVMPLVAVAHSFLPVLSLSSDYTVCARDAAAIPYMKIQCTS